MGPRNLLILFFSTLAISLVILIIFFSLFFKDVDLSFETREPDGAPDLTTMYGKEEGERGKLDEDDLRSKVNVPGSILPPPPSDKILKELVDEENAEAASEAQSTASESKTSDTKKPQQPNDDEARTSAAEITKKSRSDSQVEPNTEPKKPTPEANPLKPKVTTETKPIEPKKIPVTPVKPVVTPPPPPNNPAPVPSTSGDASGKKTKASGSNYQVYMDGFGSREAAQAKLDQLKSSGVNGYVKSTGNGFQIQMGSFGSKDNAQTLAGRTGAKVKTSQ